jgi:hypothetical protein
MCLLLLVYFSSFQDTDSRVYTVFCVSRAIGELGYLVEYDKKKRGRHCRSCDYEAKCWNFIPRMSCYNASFFTLSIVESYAMPCMLT